MWTLLKKCRLHCSVVIGIPYFSEKCDCTVGSSHKWFFFLHSNWQVLSKISSIYRTIYAARVVVLVLVDAFCALLFSYYLFSSSYPFDIVQIFFLVLIKTFGIRIFGWTVRFLIPRKVLTHFFELNDSC